MSKSYYLVRYRREGLTINGMWAPVIDGGFVSEECTLDEVKAKVAEIVGWHDGITARISTPVIHAISENERDQWLASDSCFWSRAFAKMTGKAVERFRQGNA